jgi:hypothetical protein
MLEFRSEFHLISPFFSPHIAHIIFHFIRVSERKFESLFDRDFTLNINGKIVIARAKIFSMFSVVIFINNPPQHITYLSIMLMMKNGSTSSTEEDEDDIQLQLETNHELRKKEAKTSMTP